MRLVLNCPGLRPWRARPGFTLVELLVVMTISALLAGFALGVFEGAQRRAAIARARSELAALGQVLELYRGVYGDYPETADTPEKLYQALAGKLGPTGDVIAGRNLISEVRVNVRDPLQSESLANAFIDPWGRAYQYVFFTGEVGSAPLQRGYVLFSFGLRNSNSSLPTRSDVVPSTSGAQGGSVSGASINLPNIYANP